MLTWPLRISFGNNLTIALVSYFLKINGGRNLRISERLGSLRATSLSSQSDAIAIIFCSHTASI